MSKLQEAIVRAEQGDIGAMYDLVGYYSDPNVRDKGEFVKWMRVLAGKGDALALFELGAIYCGYEEGQFWQAFGGLSEYINPKEGFVLVHKALEVEERGNDIQNLYSFYSDAVKINKMYTRDKGELAVKHGLNGMDLLNKRSELAIRAKEILRQNRNSFPAGFADATIPFWEEVIKTI